MTPTDYAAIAAKGMLLKFLRDRGFDTTPVSEEIGEVARRIAAYAIYMHATRVRSETEEIAFPPGPQLRRVAP